MGLDDKGAGRHVGNAIKACHMMRLASRDTRDDTVQHYAGGLIDTDNGCVDRAATSGFDFELDANRGSVSNALLCRVLDTTWQRKSRTHAKNTTSSSDW